MELVDGNIGSKVTMKYPAVFLLGEHAKGETRSIAFAGEGQHQDAGAKIVHAAPNTHSQRTEELNVACQINRELIGRLSWERQ